MQQSASYKLESLLYRKSSAKEDCGTLSAHNQLEKALDADAKSLKSMEAAIGIEPMDKGFADLCLTTWLRRRIFKRKAKANLSDADPWPSP